MSASTAISRAAGHYLALLRASDSFGPRLASVPRLMAKNDAIRDDEIAALIAAMSKILLNRKATIEAHDRLIRGGWVPTSRSAARDAIIAAVRASDRAVKQSRFEYDWRGTPQQEGDLLARKASKADENLEAAAYANWKPPQYAVAHPVCSSAIITVSSGGNPYETHGQVQATFPASFTAPVWKVVSGEPFRSHFSTLSATSEISRWVQSGEVGGGRTLIHGRTDTGGRDNRDIRFFSCFPDSTETDDQILISLTHNQRHL